MWQQTISYLSDGIGRIVGFLPNVVSAVIILAIGYLLSRVAGSLVRRVFSHAHFDGFVVRRLHARASAPGRSASSTVGSAVFWLGMLVTLSMASDSLRLVTLSSGINRILIFVPRIIVASLIVGIAITIGNVLADLVRGMASPWLSSAVRVSIIAFACFMALDELGIARTIVITTFSALLGAAAVAAAIAFGVGNIPIVREQSRGWVQRKSERAGVEPFERYEAQPLSPRTPIEESEIPKH